MCALPLALTCMTAQAAEPMMVEQYGFLGLSRMTQDSLLMVLPPKGILMDEELLAKSIRNLYATEQFLDIKAKMVNGTVLYEVKERPMIAEVSFSGNKLIPKQALEEGLKRSGLAQGQVLKYDTLYGIQNELKNQYLSQGYYNSDIEVIQTPIDGNRVKLEVLFTEGKPARVVDINVLGNKHFSSANIKDSLSLKEQNWNIFSKSSHYAQEKFAQSLDDLKALYQNAGFARFELVSSSLDMDKDKQKVYVQLVVNEGERYRFGGSSFVGDNRFDLKDTLGYQEQATFNQSLVDKTTQQIAKRYGDAGFYNAQIRPMLRIDDQSKTVFVEYYINPNRPVMVRRINFSGNIKTRDEVLRREMRQLEGALASQEHIALSQARLMRTGYFKDVKVDIRPVAGFDDQIDINFAVEEQPSGSATAALGYSQSGGLTFQFGLSQSNFLGTGNKVNADFSRSETRDVYSLSYTDPYFTPNGVSQSLGAYYRKTKYDDKNISNYVLDSYGANANYGYPINENQRLSAGIGADNTKVRGGRWMPVSTVKALVDDGGRADFGGNAPSFSHNYKTVSALLGYSYSSLDKPVFPTKGANHNLDLTVGFGNKNYQKVVYRGNYYHPLAKGLVLRAYTNLGYGKNLPFYENFYAGGYGSVRGYEASSLGPQSQAYNYIANGQRTDKGEKIGGNALISFGGELVLPMPFKGDWTDQVRPVLFVEGGQVFDTQNLDKKMVDIRTIDPSLANARDSSGKLLIDDSNAIVPLIKNDKDLRYSVGIGATWNTPIGPLSISYAKPIANKAGDDVEKVQFQIGSVF